MNTTHSFSSTSARRFAIGGILISFFILGTFVPSVYAGWNEESQVDDPSFSGSGYTEDSYSFSDSGSNSGTSLGPSPSSPTGATGYGTYESSQVTEVTSTQPGGTVSTSGDVWNETRERWEREVSGDSGTSGFSVISSGLSGAGGYTGENHTYSCSLALGGPPVSPTAEDPHCKKLFRH